MEVNFLIKKHIIYITITYFLAHALLFFVNGIWWDDWIIYDANRDLVQLGYMVGNPLSGYVNTFISKLPHPEAFIHILVFLLYYITTVSLYCILRKIDFLDDDASLFITVLFETIYVNEARVTAICFYYALSNMLFFFTFYLFVLWKESATSRLMKLAVRIVILALFFVTFTTNSFLIFYIILLIYILYKEKTLTCYNKYIDFLLLPFVFFAIKHYYWPTFGYYSNYNKITFESVILAIKQLHQGIWYAYLYPIYQSTPYHLEPFLLFALITLVVTDRLLLKNNSIIIVNKNKNFGLKNIFLGIFFLMIAVFPYLVIFSVRFLEGLNYNSFSTRHLLLAPLGISWITYFLFKYVFYNRRVLITALLIVVSLNIIQWNKVYLIYELYWYKQVALGYLLRNEQFIKDNDTFAFIDVDRTAHNSSIYAFYSLAGVLKRAFNDEKRLMFRIEDFERIQGYSSYFNKDYLLGDYTGDYTKIDVTIYFESNLTMKNLPVLRYYDFVQSTRFETLLREKNSIRVVKHIND